MSTYPIGIGNIASILEWRNMSTCRYIVEDSIGAMADGIYLRLSTSPAVVGMWQLKWNFNDVVQSQSRIGCMEFKVPWCSLSKTSLCDWIERISLGNFWSHAYQLSKFSPTLATQLRTSDSAASSKARSGKQTLFLDVLCRPHVSKKRCKKDG